MSEVTKQTVVLKPSTEIRLNEVKARLATMCSVIEDAWTVIRKVTNENMSPADAMGEIIADEAHKIRVKAQIDMLDPGLFDQAESEF